jgi:serine/threonine-protein kinase
MNKSLRKLLIAGSAAFAALTFAPTAHADPTHPDTVMCPSGAVAVVGGQTSCAFAENVGTAYRASSRGVNEVVSIQVPSPVTGQWYDMTCVSVHPAYCTGGNDAEVAVY